MIVQLFENLQTGGSAFVDFLKSLIQSVITIFWTEGVDDAAGKFTTVGILLLVGMAVGIVYGIISYITQLVKLRG